MRIVRVNASQPCPDCKTKKVSVTTASQHNNYFNENDLITCDKCGREGHIHWCNDTFFYEWQPKPVSVLTEKEKLMQELTELINDSDMMGVQREVVNVYNQSKGVDSIMLHKALGMIGLLRQLKEKGLL